MEIRTDEHGSVQYITLQGRLETSTSASFEAATDQLLHQGHRLFLIDAASLESVSSAGIGSLVRFARSTERAGGFLAVVGCSSEVQWLFEFFGLTRILPVYSSYAEGERALLERKSGSGLSILTAPPRPRAIAEPRAVTPERVDPDTMSPERAPASFTAAAQTHAGAALAPDLVSLEKSLARVIESLERIPEAIFELRESRPQTAGSKHFHSPIVVDCRKCASHLRIKKAGDHLCPRCGARFRVNPAGEADFSSGLTPWQTQPASLSASHS